MKTNRMLLLAVVLVAVTQAGRAADRQSRDDAWWTGPWLAASPGTLPPGHFLIEPYVFDAIPRGHYDNDGTRHSGPHANNFGSQSYVLYGLTDRVGVGLIPRFGFNDPGNGRSSSKVGVGDLTVQAQYGLSRFAQGSWISPTPSPDPPAFATSAFTVRERVSEGALVQVTPR